jgi:hypothetical protein
MEPGSDAREVVISFIKALNDEDFNLARRCVNDKISFVGPMGSRQGAEATSMIWNASD